MKVNRLDHQTRRVARVFGLVYAFLCLWVAMPAEAVRIHTNWSDRVDVSEKVIRGEVVSIKSYWDSEQTRIYTDVGIFVDEHIKGAGPLEMIITVPGGTVGADTLSVSDTPHFEVGDYAVILLEASGHVTGGPDGIYPIQKPMIGINQLQSLTEDPFLAWIKSYVNGQTRISFEEDLSPLISMEQTLPYATLSGANPQHFRPGRVVSLLFLELGSGHQEERAITHDRLSI